MEKSMNVYLAIESAILLKGFEGLILEQFNNAQVNVVSNPKELFEINFNKDPETQKILIYDAAIGFDQPNLYLHNLIQTYPNLRALVLTSECNVKRMKFLLNAGISGVLSPEISSKDFVDMLHDVCNGKICLSPKYQKLVINQFCKKEENRNPIGLEINDADSYSENEYVDELFGLTKREKEILCLVCNGMNTKEISEELFISLHTAETHRRNLLNKLDVKNTAQMVKVAVVSRLIAI